MTTTQLHDALHAKPFRPFSLRLADGRALPVKHPENVAYTQGGRTAVVMQADEHVNIVDLLLVVSLEFGAPAPKSGRRGK